MHRRAGGRGDDGDGLRVFRQRLFVRGIEKPLALQLRLELLEGDVQVARALRRELGDIKLIGPVAREHADAPEGDDLHAVLGTEAQTQGVSLEQHAAHRALGVLEREVVVARGVELVVRDLAAHEDLLQLRHAVEQSLDEVVGLADREDHLLFHAFSCEAFFLCRCRIYKAERRRARCSASSLILR